jgi:acetyltransferase-like isoleucine patch superfamily enzyme
MINKIKNLNKITFFNFILPIIKIVGPIFFDKKYLRGQHFDKSSVGWTWVLRGIIWQKIFGFNRHIPWPVSPFIVISNPNNIQFDVDNLDNFNLSFGNYFQNFNGSIIIGKGTYIAPNVGIITANHDPNNLECYLPANNVVIGQNCWIGMNSVILPGVNLGDHTIVGAGSVVTKSFFEGNCIIAGNPAKLIKFIDK